MRLRKKIKINVYWVLAAYKMKKENTPILAILQAVAEAKSYVNAQWLSDYLLHPLSVQACENLLVRLKEMGYLVAKENDYFDEGGYTLSELGITAVSKKVFFEDKKGTLKIYVAETNDFIHQRILKIEEIDRDIEDSQNEHSVIQLPRELYNLTNSSNIISLKKGEFILEHFEKKGIVGKAQEEVLAVKMEKSGAVAQILDYEYRTSKWSENLAKNEILRNEFQDNFVEKRTLVKVPFNVNNVRLKRNENIPRPLIGFTVFESWSLNLDVSPNSTQDAKVWYLALLKKKIETRSYFMSDVEFTEYSNALASEFQLFEKILKNKFLRSDLVKLFNKKEDFYTRVKLETIDYLNY